MMALRELPFGRFRMPRYPDLTYKNAVNRMDEPWVRHNEPNGVPFHNVLTGHVSVNHFCQSSQLQVVINQIYVFFEHERENWTQGKARFVKMENFSKNFFNTLASMKRNLDWRPIGKPPIDRETYDRLMLCYEFEPFNKHWSGSKKRRAKGYKDTIKFYYDTFNQECQAEIRHQIDRDDTLMNTYYVL